MADGLLRALLRRSGRLLGGPLARLGKIGRGRRLWKAAEEDGRRAQPQPRRMRLA